MSATGKTSFRICFSRRVSVSAPEGSTEYLLRLSRRLDSGAQIDTDTINRHSRNRGIAGSISKPTFGGQRQRVAIARALGMSPRLLLMDEPLTSLDAGLKNRILPYLYHIKQAYDIPLLYVTHSISEVMALADEAFLLSEGRITARGEPHQLLASPSALPVAQMTGVENILALPVVVASEERGVTELALGEQKLLVSYTEAKPGATMPIAIRARDIIVALDADLRMSARNILRGTIRQIAVQAGRVMLSVDIEEHLLSVEVTSDAREQLGLVEGTVCYFIIKASAVNLLWEA